MIKLVVDTTVYAGFDLNIDASVTQYCKGIPMENSRLLFASRLRPLRKLRAISQGRLARQLGFAQSTISEIENFQESGVEFSLEKAELISRALGYELWQMLLPVDYRLDIDDPEGFGVSDFRRAISRLSALINCYSELSEEDQQRVNTYTRDLLNESSGLIVSEGKSFPKPTPNHDEVSNAHKLRRRRS